MHRTITAAALSIAALTWLAAPAAAADPELMKDPPGVKVGEKAPDFELTDQYGKKRSLESFLKDSNTAIVFYRSAEW